MCWGLGRTDIRKMLLIHPSGGRGQTRTETKCNAAFKMSRTVALLLGGKFSARTATGEIHVLPPLRSHLGRDVRRLSREKKKFFHFFFFLNLVVPDARQLRVSAALIARDTKQNAKKYFLSKHLTKKKKSSSLCECVLQSLAGGQKGKGEIQSNC